MKTAKKILVILMVLSLSVCLFAGCEPKQSGEPEATATPDISETPTPSEEPTASLEPTLEPTVEPTPEPTPLPPVNERYTWDYTVQADGSAYISIVMKEGITPQDITEVVVPSEIDGHPVTTIPWDLLGARSQDLGRKGLCYVFDDGTWGEPENFVQKLYIPNTIKTIENEVFVSGAPYLTEIIFEDGIDVTEMWKSAFGYCPAINNYMKEHDGVMLLGSGLAYIAPAEDIVIPDGVKYIGEYLLRNPVLDSRDVYGGNFNYSKVKSVTINEGCEKIGKRFLYDAKNVEWVYIPDSVTSIEKEFNRDRDNSKVTIKCHAGSYAESWAKAEGFNVEIVGEPAPLYTWDVYIDREGVASPYIVVSDDVDRTLITEVEVPEEINGIKITRIPFDLLGCDKVYDGKKGLAKEENGSWGRPESYVQKVIFPATITEFAFDGFPFYFDPDIKAEFKGNLEDIEWIDGQALEWAKNNGYYKEKPFNGIADVSTADEFVKAYEYLDTVPELTINLLADIDLSSTAFTPKTVNNNGTFTLNGNKHFITGLTASKDDDNIGLIAAINAPEYTMNVNYVTFKGAVLKGDIDDSVQYTGAGVIVGYVNSALTLNVNSCSLIECTVNGGHWTGGIYGYAKNAAAKMTVNVNNVVIEKCNFEAPGSVGNVAGHAGGDRASYLNVDGITIKGNNVNSTGSSTIKAGSIVGTVGLGIVEVKNIMVMGGTVVSGGEANSRYYGRLTYNGNGSLIVNDEYFPEE